MKRFELKVLWTDDDGMFELGFRISSSSHSAYHETYQYPDKLKVFAQSLERFPQDQASEATLECGSQDPKFHDHLRLRAFVLKPNGHSALEVESKVRGVPPLNAETHFFVSGMPADFNRLGSALVTWLESPTKELVLEWQDA